MAGTLSKWRRCAPLGGAHLYLCGVSIFVHVVAPGVRGQVTTLDAGPLPTYSQPWAVSVLWTWDPPQGHPRKGKRPL